MCINFYTNVILDLFRAKKPSQANKEGVENCSDFIPNTSKQDDTALQDLMTSFNSNDSIEFNYPSSADDNFMNTPLITKGTLHLIILNVISKKFSR